LPLVVHIRNADAKLGLQPRRRIRQRGAALFSGNREEAVRAIDYGFFLSVGGADFTNLVRDLLANALESILFETDAPYLIAPSKAEPALIQLVYQKLAETLGRSFAEIEAQIDRNAETFFEFE
jgi:Tat protein secretion system quality control protein TatD with DNase activity